MPGGWSNSYLFVTTWCVVLAPVLSLVSSHSLRRLTLFLALRITAVAGTGFTGLGSLWLSRVLAHGSMLITAGYRGGVAWARRFGLRVACLMSARVSWLGHRNVDTCMCHLSVK